MSSLPAGDAVYQSIYDQVPVGLAHFTLDGTVLGVNRKLCEMVGHEAGELIGRRLLDLADPEDAGVAIERRDALLRGDCAGYTLEQRYLRKNGTPVWLKVDVSLVRDDGNRAACLIGVVEDGNGRQSAAVAVEAEAVDALAPQRTERGCAGMFASIARMSTQGIGWAALDGRVLYMNPTLRRWLDIAAEADPCAFTVGDFYGDADRERVVATVWPRVAGEGHWSGDIELRSLGGRSLATIHEVLLVRDARGEPLAYAGIVTDISERRALERDLHDSRASLRLVLDNIPVAVSYVDAGERVLFANARVAAWQRRPLQTIEGRALGECLGADEYTRVAPFLRRALAGERVRFELPLHFPDGEFRHVEISYVPHRHGGQVLGVFALTDDVTHRKQVEQELRQARQDLELVTDNVPALLARVDTAGRFRFVNRLYERWWRRPVGEIVGRPAEELYGGHNPPELMPVLRGHFDRALRGERVRYEASVRYADGATRIVEGQLVPELTDGGVAGVFSLISDISERVEAQAALSRERAFVNGVLDNAGAIIVVVDRHGHIERFNRAAEILSGYPFAEARGRRMLELLVPAGERDVVGAAFADVTRCGRSVTLTSALRTRSGEARVVEWTASALHDGTGAVTHFIGIGTDVTERHVAELALQQSRALLAEAQALAHLGNWELDLLTGRASWSDEEYRLLGYAPGVTDASYENFLAAVHTEDRDAVRAAMAAAMHPGAGGSCAIEHRVGGSGAPGRVLAEVGRVSFDARGRPVRMFGTTLDVTGRVQMENALRQERNFVLGVLDSAAAPVAVLDLEGRITRFNRACEVLSGYSAAEVCGRCAWDLFVSEAEREPTRERFRRIADGGPAFTTVAPLQARDGSARIIEWSTTILRDPDGLPEYVIGIGNDVTEKQAALDALRRSEDVFAQAEAIAHIGSWEMDLLTGSLHWSNEVYRIFGLEYGTFGGSYDAFLQFVHEADRQAVINAVNATLEDPGRTYQIRHRVVRPDGQIRYVDERSRTYRDADGRPLRMIGAVHDVTEEVKALESLRESEERFRTTFETASDGIVYACAATGRILQANRRFLELTGYDEQSLGRMHVDALHPPEARDNVLAIFDRFRTDPLRIAREVPIRRRDGSVFHADISGAIVTVEGTAYLAGFFRDVSERMAAQEAIQRTNEALERRVLERTAELERQKRRAEEASQAKTEFLSRMSHELRTPLNAILGFSELIHTDEVCPVPQQHRQNLEEVIDAGHHLLELINEVLDLARVEAGFVALSPVPISVSRVVAESVALIRPLADKRALRLETDGDADAGLCVYADPMRTRQVLVNLMSNAVKYNRDDGTVAVTWRRVTGDKVRLEVTDTGYGLSDAAQARLFQPFDRLDADRSITEGTGIGLALSKRLVDAMSGAIGVLSRPDAGSTFWFELPVHSEPGMS
ncbi:MAG: PAS domain S-box protein [Gammaproteobacteria bacterium]|nr:PAS domain S-box protein [Gammaproteobacteria bacterium]